TSMIETQTPIAVPEVPPLRLAPGVAAANEGARRLERAIALVIVVTPFLGVLAGVALLWGKGVGLVELGLLAGMYLVSSIGIGIGLGYHRLASHGSFQTYPLVRAILAIFGSIASQGPVYYWAAIHRRHHALGDRPGDPHSPYLGHGEGLPGFLRGLWHAHVG